MGCTSSFTAAILRCESHGTRVPCSFWWAIPISPQAPSKLLIMQVHSVTEWILINAQKKQNASWWVLVYMTIKQSLWIQPGLLRKCEWGMMTRGPQLSTFSDSGHGSMGKAFCWCRSTGNWSKSCSRPISGFTQRGWDVIECGINSQAVSTPL